MALQSVYRVRYSTYQDDYGDYHEVMFDELHDAVRFTRDHAWILRSTDIAPHVLGLEDFTLGDLANVSIDD